MPDYCIATLSAGRKYNNYLLTHLLSNEDLKNAGAEIIITTDDEELFKRKGYKTFGFTPEYLGDIRSNRDKKWFNYHQKSLAIKNAFNSGYTKIFYVDSDINILKWDEKFLIKKDRGFWFRTQLPREQHIEKYKFYDETYQVSKWHYYRPVSEKVIYINECADKILGFLTTWEHLAEEAKGKVNPYSEGHEILLACRFNGASVNKYRPDPFKGDKKLMEDAHL